MKVDNWYGDKLFLKIIFFLLWNNVEMKLNSKEKSETEKIYSRVRIKQIYFQIMLTKVLLMLITLQLVLL